MPVAHLDAAGDCEVASAFKCGGRIGKNEGRAQVVAGNGPEAPAQREYRVIRVALQSPESAKHASPP